MRSSVESNAEGERGTWTFVLTDSGLVTYTKSMSTSGMTGTYTLIKEGRGEGATYCKSVKLAKGLQTSIIRCISASNNGGRCRGCWFPRAWWKPV